MSEKAPMEIEKKFLIKMPDLEWIKANTDVEVAEIAQTYLGMKENGFGDRVRMMTIDGNTKYYYTSKKSVSHMSRIEIESEITKEEYDNFLMMPHRGNTLLKTRYIIHMNNLKYEIDVYPFWEETAILEIELKSEDEKYEIPDFIEILGDVTGNKDYSNNSLSNKYKMNKDF